MLNARHGPAKQLYKRRTEPQALQNRRQQDRAHWRGGGSSSVGVACVLATVAIASNRDAVRLQRLVWQLESIQISMGMVKLARLQSGRSSRRNQRSYLLRPEEVGGRACSKRARTRRHSSAMNSECHSKDVERGGGAARSTRGCPPRPVASCHSTEAVHPARSPSGSA